jgi:Glu-tRNA(Gln) amidotransferase subunit E-like FAD-binding protein
MITHEYLDCSMYGSYWVPCEVIGTGEDGKITVKYFETTPGYEPGYTEEDVAPDRIREVNTEITKQYLSEVAEEAAKKFKDDLIIIDEELLSKIADAVAKSLCRHFNL